MCSTKGTPTTCVGGRGRGGGGAYYSPSIYIPKSVHSLLCPSMPVTVHSWWLCSAAPMVEDGKSNQLDQNIPYSCTVRLARRSIIQGLCSCVHVHVQVPCTVKLAVAVDGLLLDTLH